MMTASRCRPATWGLRRREIGLIDWFGPDRVSGLALERARRFLRDSGDPGAADLADADDLQLLERLGGVLPDGTLTQGAALLLCAPARPPFDFIHRHVAGGDTVSRLRTDATTVLEQLDEIYRLLVEKVPFLPAPEGLATAGRPQLPIRARREALVNAVGLRLDPVRIAALAPAVITAAQDAGERL